MVPSLLRLPLSMVGPGHPADREAEHCGGVNEGGRREQKGRGIFTLNYFY